MKYIKVLCFFLVMITLASSCTNPEKKSNISQTSPIEISIGFWNIEEIFEQDRLLIEQIEDDLNIRLVPVQMDYDDYKTRLKLWSSSGQMPDVLAGDVIGSQLYYQWIADALIQPLPEDLSPWPYLYAYMQTADVKKFRHFDGRFYSIPRKTYDETIDIRLTGIDRKIYYRKDMANEVGVEKDPKTYDAFRQMILKIRQDNEGVDGLTLTSSMFLDSFFLPYSVPLGMGEGSGRDIKWIESGGRFIPAYFAGDLESAFQLARQMMKEGTLSANTPMTKRQQAINSFIHGESAALLANISTLDLAMQWNDVENNKAFIDSVAILPPLKGKDGHVYGSIFHKFWSESYISTRDPIKYNKILELYDYLLKNEEKFRNKEDVTNGVINIVLWNNMERYLRYRGDEEKDQYVQMDIDYSRTLMETRLIEFEELPLSFQSQAVNNLRLEGSRDILEVLLSPDSVDEVYDRVLRRYKREGIDDLIEDANRYMEDW